jgi:hypothetical protein
MTRLESVIGELNHAVMKMGEKKRDAESHLHKPHGFVNFSWLRFATNPKSKAVFSLKGVHLK